MKKEPTFFISAANELHEGFKIYLAHHNCEMPFDNLANMLEALYDFEPSRPYVIATYTPYKMGALVQVESILREFNKMKKYGNMENE